jgi:HK97 family phage prohead protease
MEHKIVGLSELKFAEGDGVAAMEFTGYGAVFGNVDSYGDVIAPGAFADTIANSRKSGRWPAMLSQHGAMGLTSEDLTPVGIWTDMAEDGVGLKMTGILADTQRGIELYKLMKMKPRPAIDGLSIGYIAKESIPRSRPDEPRRTLKRIDLIETSPVTFPANGLARVSAVKSIEHLDTLSEIERHLRDACGFSKSEALAMVSRVKSVISRSDSGEREPLAVLADALKTRAVF